MGKFIKGDIVVIPFPFSDLSQSKKRPALVISDNLGDDIILCQITSRFSPSDLHVVVIDHNSFSNGNLPLESNIRPNRIFTADMNIIIKKVGSLKNDVYEQGVEKIKKIISK